jgi:hypothetical protein
MIPIVPTPARTKAIGNLKAISNMVRVTPIIPNQKGSINIFLSCPLPLFSKKETFITGGKAYRRTSP